MDLDKGDAALVGSGSKTGKVADYAAAESEDGGTAVGMVLQQSSVDLLEGFVIFVLFAVGQDDAAGTDAELSAGGFNRSKVERGNGLVADDGGFAANVWADVFGQIIKQAKADVDGVAVAGGTCRVCSLPSSPPSAKYFSHPTLEFNVTSLIFKPAQVVCRALSGIFLFTLNRVATNHQIQFWREDL
ncbi:hypothetical protein A7P99_07800 [Eikenella sp. NML120348]|nr:hypothetical protein A7P99_07800 [Eikenella sp. NML120348]